MSRSSENLTAADVTRQAELVVMEYLKSMKYTQTLDAMMQKSKIKSSSSVVASELYAVDLDSKKKAPQEFKSILEYMISTSSARTASESSTSESGDGSAPTRSSRRRSSSVSSDSDMGETIWTKDDISRLKKAIKQTTSVEDKNERWKEIALLVGNGKSKKHCYVKYKELKEEKKSSGTGSSSSRGSSPSSFSRRSSVEDNRSGKTLPTTGGNQGEPEKVKPAKAKDANDVLSIQQPSLSARDEKSKKPSIPPLSSTPHSTIAGELQMEDVEDFDSVYPSAVHSSTQNRTSSGGKPHPVSSGSGPREGGSRGGRAPTADEIASLQLLLFSDDKKGFSSHWDEQVCNNNAFRFAMLLSIDQGFSRVSI